NLSGWSGRLVMLRDVQPYRGAMLSLSASPGGRSYLVGLASADIREGEAQLVEAGTGKRIGQPFPHGSPVWAESFSPCGKWVATGAEDGTARLWEVASGRPIGAPMRHEGRVVAVAFHPSGHTLLTVDKKGVVRTWDVTTAAPIGAVLSVSV